MTTKELLGVLVRAIGFWLLAMGLAQLPTTIWNFHYTEGTDIFTNAARTAVSYSVAQIIVGGTIFIVADGIVRVTYPDPVPPEEDDGDESEI